MALQAALGTETEVVTVDLAADTVMSVEIEQNTQNTLFQGALKRRILSDKDCGICGDRSSGIHYGVFACDGCSGFFKRASRRTEAFLCKNYGTCEVSKDNRNVCRACRLGKCLEAGMNLEGARRRSGKSPHLSNNEGKQDLTLAKGVYVLPRETNSGPSAPDNNQLVSYTTYTTEQPSRAELEVTCKEEQDLTNTPAEYVVDYVTSSAGQVVRMSPVLSEQQGVTNVPENTSSSSVLISGSHSTHALQGAVVPFTAGSEGAVRVTWPPHPALHVSRQHDVTVAAPRPSPPTAVASVQSSSSSQCSPVFCTQQELVDAIKPVSFYDSESLQEASSRLMNASIQFARNVSCFCRTLFRDQVILLEESWKELFLLDAAYWALPMEMPFVGRAACGSQDVEARQRGADIRSIQEALSRMQALQINLTELAHIKAILLFKPETKGLKDPDRVEKIQEEIQLLLLGYIKCKFPDQPARFGKLLLSLLTLHTLAADDQVERVFFKKVEGRDIFETLLSQLISSG